jgi:hypothetical protein
MAARKIGKSEYTYRRLPADEGLRMLLRFLKIAGPAGGVVEALLSGDEAKRDALALSSIKAWLTEFDPDQVYDFLMDLSRNVQADGLQLVPGVLETGEFLQVMQFAIETELSGFFADGQASAFIKPRPAAA